MLHLSKELVPHVERLLPALRAGTVHDNLRPVVNFALAYQASGEGTAREVLEQLNSCPTLLFGLVCEQLNEELRAAKSGVRVNQTDLATLQDVVGRYWQTLTMYV